MGLTNIFSRLFGDNSHPTIISETLPVSNTGEIITESKAMKISAFYSCVALFADIFSVVRPVMYQEKDGIISKENGNLSKLLTLRPNKTQSASFFWGYALTSLAIKGAFYGYIVRDSQNRISELLPIHPDDIQIVLSSEDKGGVSVQTLKGFLYTDADGVQKPLSTRDLFYIFGRSVNGITPVSPLTEMANALGVSLKSDDYQAAAYKNGIKPSMILTYPNKLNPESRASLEKNLTDRNSGKNIGKIMVLDHGGEAKSITISPSDMQLIESNNFHVQDIARFFRVDPRFLYLPQSAAGWSTVEMMSQEFVRYSLLPWGERIEDAINTQLVREIDQGKRYAQINYDDLVKADIETRMKSYGENIRNGVMSPNEVRQKENLNPYSGGDIYVMQAQMLPIDKLGEMNGNQTEID